MAAHSNKKTQHKNNKKNPTPTTNRQEKAVLRLQVGSEDKMK